ncbi:MAG: tRNA1(Val) (adenine(37)-N6)-methyltransferase [Bacillota bacterium]|nr:tRNA1(Val) (adenine(37)-N6)-methyltransferase [Bacillota bacterium]
MNEQGLPCDERIDELGCGGMKIIQDASAPCFAVDAVLLAHFAAALPGERVIELGSGSGVIALLLAYRQPDCHIRGVELIPRMAALARRSVVLNGLERRIEIIDGDIRQPQTLGAKAAYDVVISNPPYYRAGAGRVSEDALFAAARSELYCSLPQLLTAAQRLCRPLGRLYLVHRSERLGELLALLPQYGFKPSRLQLLHPYADKAAKLLLIEAFKGGRRQLSILPPLIMYDAPNVYSKQMRAVYAAFAHMDGAEDER